MSIVFEHNYQQRVMIQKIESSTGLTPDFFKNWQGEWTAQLGGWHSPYSVLLDLESVEEFDPEAVIGISNLFKFFSAFFMKKMVILLPKKVDAVFPDEIAVEYDRTLALKKVGLREARALGKDDLGFRESISIQNHFQQQTVEISFLQPSKIANLENVGELKSKLTNNLMQWHSSWSLMIDCQQLELAPELVPQLEKMFIYFKGLHLKEVVFHSKNALLFKELGFPCFRSRHKAAANIKKEVERSGNDAHCRSK